MKVGFIQFEPYFGRVDRNLERAEALIRQSDAEVLVLPECFNTGYLFLSKEEVWDLSEEVPGGKTSKLLFDLAGQRNQHIVAGLVERADNRLFNAAVIVSPKGFLGVYRKIHLFSEEKLWFTPGDLPFPVYDIGIGKIGVMICFDWFFPESARILALNGADVICHCANLVLPFCQDGMITRCLENRVFAVTANRTGDERRGDKVLAYTGRSQITGPQGNILYRASVDQDEIGFADIDVKHARNKRLNVYNHLLNNRRVDMYGDLVRNCSQENKTD
ncbi:MAG TPA: nitrilase-related carbon-nitrogen hydrolase [Syntrophales bacterium]|nr:nitrilase-related carbon-nitrogen hydrolase [Syntrophales bacterium]